MAHGDEAQILARGDHQGRHLVHAGHRLSAGDQTRNDTRKEPGHQYAQNYSDPITGGPLQVYPPRSRSEFESDEDYWKHVDAVSRWNNGLPPPRPKPNGREIGPEAGPPRLPHRHHGSSPRSHDTMQFG